MQCIMQFVTILAGEGNQNFAKGVKDECAKVTSRNKTFNFLVLQWMW